MPLDFTRFSVATEGARFEEEIKQAIEEVKKANAPKTLLKQIGIWFAYYKRDYQEAVIYLDRYRTSLKADKDHDSLDFAEVNNDIGRALTTDGAYIDFSLFLEALEIFTAHKQIDNPDNRERVMFGMAFAFQQIGLMHHRLSENKNAQEYFKKAYALYLELTFANYNKYIMHVAEAHHLLGVSYVRSDKLEVAAYKLGLAYAIETAYEKNFGPHYLSFITAQSLADCTRYLALKHPHLAQELLAEANEILTKTYDRQINYYKTRSHADIAKTLAFLGDNYFAVKNYPTALKLYVATLEMKLDFFKEANHPLVVVTLKALDKLFKEWVTQPVNTFNRAGKEDILNLEKLSLKHSLGIQIPPVSVMPVCDSEKISISYGLGATVFGASVNKPVTTADPSRPETPRAGV